MSNPRKDSTTPPRDPKAEEILPSELTKEQEDKVKGGLQGTQRSGIWEN